MKISKTTFRKILGLTTAAFIVAFTIMAFENQPHDSLKDEFLNPPESSKPDYQLQNYLLELIDQQDDKTREQDVVSFGSQYFQSILFPIRWQELYILSILLSLQRCQYGPDVNATK